MRIIVHQCFFTQNAMGHRVWTWCVGAQIQYLSDNIYTYAPIYSCNTLGKTQIIVLPHCRNDIVCFYPQEWVLIQCFLASYRFMISALEGYPSACMSIDPHGNCHCWQLNDLMCSNFLFILSRMNPPHVTQGLNQTCGHSAIPGSGHASAGDSHLWSSKMHQHSRQLWCYPE